MALALQGVAKLIEECGELSQVLGKKLAYWDVEIHPDGLPIQERMEAEIGDVLAAIEFVTEHLHLDEAEIRERKRQKAELFAKWHAQDNNNEHAVDELARTEGHKAGILDGIKALVKDMG